MHSPFRLREQIFKVSYGPGEDRLHDFYIPTLSCSVRYDRMTGFFNSASLAIAAAGVARLIRNGGMMRLLVGAELFDADVEAIAHGQSLEETVSDRLLSALEEPASEVMRRRLEILAWMVASDTLHMRVVLCKGPNGLPLPAALSHDYFHPKIGLFTDAAGDRIAFSGSINESIQGWQNNYEQFLVFRSWEQATYVAELAGHFNRLWEDREPDWIAIDVPEAARARLLRFKPKQAPTRDPLEKPEKTVAETEREDLTTDTSLRNERILFQFLRDAPYMIHARGLGAATAAVQAWPHQSRVADTIVDRFPGRYLLCDEVGLGKTIEVGQAFRQLILSGTVQRSLILAPRSVCRQWQEELYEKFALNIPFFDGHVFRDLDGTVRPPQTTNHWDSEAVFIASSQLAKRRDRQRELVAARPWDLIVVDEAHHARRKDFLYMHRRPNNLLELLGGRPGQPGLKDLTRSLLLLTATPMQIHPVEVWDLLRLLGMGGRWGASERNFLQYFSELRRPPEDIRWGFILDMVRESLALGGTLDPDFEQRAVNTLGLVDWQRLRVQVSDQAPNSGPVKLNAAMRAVAVEMARSHTPLRELMFRNTRRLLREYIRQGILKSRIPRRAPQPVWIAMRPEERGLYDRIEEYITGFYRKYEQERKGLGFVMTVYRRRLTSSLYAVRCSLERRLEFLKGYAISGSWAGMDDDDIEQEDLLTDITEDIDEQDHTRFSGEIEYIEDFLAELRGLGDNDSKVEQLLDDLHLIFKQRSKALVFTQYTDTMDYLRNQLRQVYGNQVACYSGRGGEIWNGIAWVSETKEAIKDAFTSDEQIKILLCTEAASEGLNLQTCGVLINYDMPWNPMRVEQRIGRIDRIGQKYDRVWLHHYFYEGTVEARVYRALENRIGWFEDVVGELQPILAQVGKTIESIAMTPQAEREHALAQALQELESDAAEQEARGFELDRYVSAREPQAAARSPVTLLDLEQALTTAPSLRNRFSPHAPFDRAYALQDGPGSRSVTFDRQLFDTHPYSVELLTYGSTTLTDLLKSVLPPETPSGRVLCCRTTVEEQPLCAYYLLKSGSPQRIEHMQQLKGCLSASNYTDWTSEDVEMARTRFQQDVEALLDKRSTIIRNRQQAEWHALKEHGRETLLQAALVELAMGQQPALFRKEVLPGAFNESAVMGLKRHRYPFAPLLNLVGAERLVPVPTDPYFLAIQGKSREALQGRRTALEQRAKDLVALLAASRENDAVPKPATVDVSTEPL